MVVVVRAAASPATTTRLHPPQPKPSITTTTTTPKRQLQQSLPFQAPATFSLLAFLTASPEAQAFSLPKEQLFSSLTKVEDTIDQVGSAGSRVLDFSQSAFSTITDAVKPGVDAVVPLVRDAGDQALKLASPLVSGASKQASDALQNAGVDLSPITSAANTVADAVKQTPNVIEGVQPIASSTLETILSTDPSLIVATGGGLFLAYLLLPSFLSAVSFNLRGYKGNLNPAQALDTISTQNYIMVDIRSEKEKSRAGIPSLPSNAKNKMISIPIEELPNKIKALIRNSKKVEAEMVALKISYLKRVNKNSRVVILDSNCDMAKTVARILTNNFGFKNCYVVSGGFKGWSRSRLGIDSYNAPFVEVLSPSKVLPAAVSRAGETGFRSTTGKFLPGITVEN